MAADLVIVESSGSVEEGNVKPASQWKHSDAEFCLGSAVQEEASQFGQA